MPSPLMNPCGHLRDQDTGACIGYQSCSRRPAGPEEMERLPPLPPARRLSLVAEARALSRAMASSGEPASLPYNLQVLVALCGHLERTAEAIRKSPEVKRLTPREETDARISEIEGTARLWRRWALTALAKSNLPEEVRHG